MNYTYVKDFDKSTVDDMTKVQAVINETGAIIDASLFPLIEEAETGDFGALAELFEMFAYGFSDVTPNYKLGLRYWTKLNEIVHRDMSDDLEIVANTYNTYAYMQSEFGNIEEANKAFLVAFQYMVANLHPSAWDEKIIGYVSENLDYYKSV